MGRETTARVFDDLGKWARGSRRPPSARAPGPPPRCPPWNTWGVLAGPCCALTCAARAWAWAVPRAAPLGQALPTKSRGERPTDRIPSMGTTGCPPLLPPTLKGESIICLRRPPTTYFIPNPESQKSAFFEGCPNVQRPT